MLTTDRLGCMNQQFIRNFCIIAHIDHGKSTLADRLLERTHTLSAREMADQVLDSMDLEREKGITIKARAVRMLYQARDGHEYELNLIDTPGHVDFHYEVSRALTACEGAVRGVDAAQGIEAQTLANVYLALEHNLELVPVINKIDLPSAEPERVRHELERVIGLDPAAMVLASAKEDIGTEEVLEAIVRTVPPPRGDLAAPLRALLDRLNLNDASLTYEPESSVALGFGFRCGFLGLLHMEIIQERLEREYDLQLLATAPSVEYQVTRTDGAELVIDNPAGLPPAGEVAEIREPWVHLSIFTPATYIGAIMELCRQQ